MHELRPILPYFRPYRAGLAVGLTLVVLTNVFGIMAPFFLGEAIDEGLEGGSMARIILNAGLIVLVTALSGAAKFGMRLLLNGVSRRMECDLRNDFFQHLLGLDAAFYGHTRTGDLMARSTNDTLAVRMAVGPAVMYAANTAVGFVFALSLMFWISPRLTLYALIPMTLLPPIVFGFARVIHQRFEEIQEQFSVLSTMVQENLTGVRIVRAYVQERAQAAQFDGMNREYMARNMGLVKIAGLFHPILALFSGVAMVIVLWFGGLEVMAGRVSVSDFIEFGIYLQMLIWPLIALGWVVNLFQRGAASMGRINKIMTTEPHIRSPDEPVALVEPRGEIEFRGVSFRYPDTERLVLDDISFTVKEGQTVAVVGPTGSGKSTLLALLPRIYDPQEGAILLDGVPLTAYDLADLRRVIGVVPQDPFLFSTTIGDNIALGIDLEERITHSAPQGPAEDPDEAVAEAARIAQLDESIQDFPKGYETLLGERGINLSGGQKQRATLARAVARDPTVLILDDALSAVDTHTESRILDDLKEVMKGRTSFIISHRVSAVMDADLILVLDEGRIVERGRHADLVALGGTYATLLRRQMLERDLESEVVAAGGD